MDFFTQEEINKLSIENEHFTNENYAKLNEFYDMDNTKTNTNIINLMRNKLKTFDNIDSDDE